MITNQVLDFTNQVSSVSFHSFKAMVANALTEIFIKGLFLELLVKATVHYCGSSLIRQGNIAVNKGKGLNLSC